MVIRVFVASSSGSVAGDSERHVVFSTSSDDDAIKKRQQDVVRFLEANRIEFEEVDITMSEEKRQWMYKNIPEDRQPAQGNPLPPQIFSDDRYCGDYDGFFESKESNTVFSFLGLKPTLTSKGHKRGRDEKRVKLENEVASEYGLHIVLTEDLHIRDA
ncbi:Sh3bgrl2 [Columba livia]|nr:Sh3bgrl2 [Columba livia]